MAYVPVSSLRKSTLLLVPVAMGLLLGCQEPAPAAQGGEQLGELPPGDALLLASVKVALPPAGLTPADLPEPGSEGARLVTQYCVACHSLASPGSHSATDWPRYIRRMWLRLERLQDSFQLPLPSAGERQVMLQYLVDNALRVTASLPAAPGRDFFAATCSSCHELPDPAVHSSEDWVAVVRRMMDHMQEIQGRTLTPEQYSRIVLYLETVSGA
ncbi:MAG: c-type cytochrome [Gemmatimonadota bacterium]|nr:MAG: c-type cytochrome [Gemmatimonadota bacterium]